MRPIAKLTATAREIATTRDPSRQLPSTTAKDEISELTGTLQEMLGALDASQIEREAAIQKQREFVADASHELRTPLTSILANLELLEVQWDGAADSEEHQIVRSAVRSSQRMSRLVSDLLVLARNDAGQHRPMVDLDLAEVAMSSAREIAASLGQRDLYTDCRPAPIHGNQDELHRLILNLLDNAIRYSPAKSQISLTTASNRATGSVQLEIADSGPGIPPNMRERIFERFVRSDDASDTSPSEGTGLGLAMVQAIAAAHGGTVAAASSAELGGAKFVVTLPARHAEGAESSVAQNLQ
jgi:signal transduction histidine kinase